jgi:hypothetical protein
MQFYQQQQGNVEGEDAAAYGVVGRVDVNGRVWGSMGWESDEGEGLTAEEMRSAMEASESTDSLVTMDSVPDVRELQHQYGIAVMDYYNLEMTTHAEVLRFYAYHAEQPFNSYRHDTMAQNVVDYL